ncbi:hypothetical protein Dalk_1805 [Desulfatibacillum aliphaticivorans]|uniref:Uncharacterized protein n=1 Tax=Desulfatibacillum aliphaticivorans TaxID=218208 RepID=B8FFU7_DESAL|nr:hypothetical protein [Desulfatibacillum aliphaticivorans]ACL03502.1 hypothetical protein Dalk_1805 [Desulfatibacillum aliphaticivorans]
MDDLKRIFPKAFCLINFWCLAMALAQGLTLAYAAIGTPTSQKSILILMGAFLACSWGGLLFYKALETLSRERRHWVLVVTAIFPAAALNVILTQSSVLSPLLLTPFILFGLFRWAPELGGEPEPDLELLATIICQIIALSLLIRTGPYYAVSFIAAAALVLGWHASQAGREEMYSIELAALISPVMALWLFVSASDQIAAIFPGPSQILYWMGLAVALLMAGILVSRKFRGGLWINRLCMAMLVASLLFDLNLGSVLAVPLADWDFHWWVHVAPGLDAMYKSMQPFVHYAPIEGVAWAAWAPRLWFEILNGSAAGYGFVFALSSLLAQALCAALMGYAFYAIGCLKPFEAACAACLIAVSNLTLLQTSYPFPGGWSIAERAPAFFLCVMAFLFFWRASEAGENVKAWAAVCLGALHMLSFLCETLLGLGAIAGLLGVMILAPQRVPQKKYILAGGFGALILILLIVRPSLWSFFVLQPLTLIQSGMKHMDPNGQVNIFSVFYRSRLLSTLHYTWSLAALTAFLCLLPFKPWKSRAFTPGLYMFLITFFMFISGGQRYFGDPEGTYSTVHFAALSSVLVIPLLICTVRIALDFWGQAPLPSWAPKALASLLIAAACTTGLFYGKSPGTLKIQMTGREFNPTAWQTQEHYNAPYDYGLGDVLSYYYTYKNRKAVLTGPAPLAIHLQPYSLWKNNPEIQVPIARTMGFFHKQEFGRD